MGDRGRHDFLHVGVAKKALDTRTERVITHTYRYILVYTVIEIVPLDWLMDIGHKRAHAQATMQSTDQQEERCLKKLQLHCTCNSCSS